MPLSLKDDAKASLRDARSTITELERQVATLRRQKSEESQASSKEIRDLRKQLNEMKDQKSILEQQISDQAKVCYVYYIHNYNYGVSLITINNMCAYYRIVGNLVSIKI